MILSTRSTTLALLALVLGTGLAGGWWLRGGGSEKVIEAPAPAIKLSNATVLERQPAHPVPAAILGAAKELKGANVMRAATLTLQPAQPGCDPIDVDLGAVRMKDGTQRLIARSDDGTVAGGVDIPIAEMPMRGLNWATGALYDVANDRYGVFVDRDLGRLRVGVDALQDGRGELAAIVRVGFRF